MEGRAEGRSVIVCNNTGIGLGGTDDPMDDPMDGVYLSESPSASSAFMALRMRSRGPVSVDII